MNRTDVIETLLLMAFTMLFADVIYAAKGKPQNQTYPALPVARWNTGRQIDLEDFRGQITVLVFFDDMRIHGEPAWNRPGKAIRAYAQKEKINIIPIALFSNPGLFNTVSKRVWGDDHAIGLDTGLANRIFSKAGKKNSIIIIGPQGKILERASKPDSGNVVISGNNQPAPLYYLKENLGKHTGKDILADISLNSKIMAKAGDYIRQCYYQKAESLLRKAKNSPTVKKDAEQLLKRISELKKEKRDLIDSLRSDGNIWQAFKTAQSYLRCFPDADDKKEVKTIVKELMDKDIVKNNIKAAGYMEAYLARSKGELHTVAHKLKQIPKIFPETEAGNLLSQHL